MVYIPVKSRRELVSPKWGARLSASKYISVMIIAASLSLLRGIVIAKGLSSSSFGIYSTIIATGMFSALLVSFGETERSIKAFPRLWIAKCYVEVSSRADASAKRLVIRTSVLLILVLILILAGYISYFPHIALFIILVGLGNVVTAIYASAIRATGETSLLAKNTLYRSIVVSILGGGGAYVYDWQGAIIGELFGTFLGIISTRRLVACQVKLNNISIEVKRYNADGHIAEDKNNDRWFYFASLLSSAPSYLDRLVVAILYGNEAVGTYSFLLIFVTCANAFTGIIAQKVGPQIIKMEYLNNSVTTQIRYASRWLVLIWFACGLGMVLAYFTLVFGPTHFLYEKYSLSAELLVATTLLCLFQVTVIADFILLSNNQDLKTFYSACIYLAAITVSVYATAWAKISLPNFILLLAFSRAAYIAAQTNYIVRINKYTGALI